MKIKIKYFSDEVKRLEKITKGDWIDLRSAEKVILKAGESAKVALGIAMELPKGYEAFVVPRGSSFKNYGTIQVNHMGVVDEVYCGDNDQWFCPLYAIRDTVIEVNDRICQFRIIEHQPDLEFEEVKVLGNKDRGGYGTTGKDEIVQNVEVNPNQLKVGDTVTIRDDLIAEKWYGEMNIVSEMLCHKGKAIIIEITDFIHLDVDGGFWNWTKEMFK